MPGPRLAIDAPDDPRIAPYLNLRDRELAVCGDLFIAEGEHLVRRLLASTISPVSILVTTRKVDEIAPLAPPHCPVYVASDAVIRGILGFKFHSGVIACATRPANPPLESLLPAGDAHATLVVCPETHNTENLGSLIRIAAALGAQGMLVGERSCDPFFRRVVRVSMGAVFTLPIVRSADLVRDLEELRRRGFELIATVVDDDGAERLDEQTRRGPRAAILFGSESQGLSRQWVSLCDRRLTIPMHLGNDSLNVAVAAGIILWRLCP